MHFSNPTPSPTPSQAQPAAPDGIAAPRAGSQPPVVLLACGNSLREDDGVGLRIAEAAREAIPASQLRIIATQQWTPELAAELGEADLAIFVDANAADEPGAIRVVPVAARAGQVETHRLDPATMLDLAESLCGHAPQRAFLLTVGAGSFGYGEQMSRAVRAAVPKAVRLVANLAAAFAANPEVSAKSCGQ